MALEQQFTNHFLNLHYPLYYPIDTLHYERERERERESIIISVTKEHIAGVLRSSNHL